MAPVAISSSDVRKALKELGALRFGSDDPANAMRQIVEATHSLFKVDGAGLMLVDGELELRNAAVSDQRCDALEELQVAHREGPCLDAYHTKELVGSDDLGADDRWPAFSRSAVQRGLRAVMASPIPYTEHVIGVVAVFSATQRAWTPEGELALMAFTDLAALLIASTIHAVERTELAEQLQSALDSRVVIEQAKGVVVARDGVSPREAYEHLRAQARRDRRPLRDLAREVVNGARRT